MRALWPRIDLLVHACKSCVCALMCPANVNNVNAIFFSLVVPTASLDYHRTDARSTVSLALGLSSLPCIQFELNFAYVTTCLYR